MSAQDRCRKELLPSLGYGCLTIAPGLREHAFGAGRGEAIR
jgi:hypothetical protein